MSPDIAEVIRARLERAKADPIPRRPAASHRALSRAQQEIWFMDRLARPAAAYTMSFALRLRGPLDLDRLRRAVESVAARHEGLRVTVEDRDGVPEAVIHPHLAVPVLVGPAPETPLDGPLLRVHVETTDFDEHDLLILAHHLVSDATSMEVIADDLACAYRGEDLGPPPHRYSDIAEWQEHRSAQRMDRDVMYWRERLRGAPEVLELAGAARPDRRTYRGRVVSARLPTGQRTEILLGAWAAVLRRHSGQDDLVIGTALSGRDRPEAERVVGPLVNLVPLRVSVDAIASPPELVDAARAALLAALDHAALPFGTLVEALRPVRTAQTHPVFQATFDVRDGTPDRFDFGCLSAEPLPLSKAPARVDLALSVERRGSARLVAAEDMFTEEHARRLLEEFTGAVEALADPPAIVLGERAGPEPDTVVRMIDRWTARTPDAVAVEDGVRSLRYAELDRRSKALAGRLRGQSVVGVMLDRGVDLVVALLAVIRAGAAYLPLDPGHPPARSGLLLAEAGAEVIVTRPGTSVPAEARIRVDVDVDAGQPTDVPVSPDDLAYVIYTSGSTGVPKGVEVTHGNLAAFLRAMGDLFDLGPHDTLLAVTTISFDIAAAELFLPLSRGGRVVVAPERAAGDPDMIRRLCANHGVTVLQTTPVTWRALGPAPVPGLRVALCGGEVLAADLARQLTGLAERAWNVYGPTETTIWSTAQPLDTTMTGRIPIGTPLPGTTAEVLGNGLRPVLPGDPGELCLGGAGVSRGYRNRPDLTAERFVTRPSGQRIYRSGDRVRLRPDGALEFLGRLDDQLKVHGLRVEPGEVEAAARDMPGVADAAVAAPNGVLTCYVTRGPAGLGGEAALRSALAEVLPAYLVPARIIVLDELPLTPNGKLDRLALPAPEPSEPSEDPRRPPRTPHEEILCGFFAELLGLPKVEVDDDFFALGGHSLLVLRLLARIEATLGVQVSIRAFFDTPSVARLAAALEPAGDGGPRLGAAPRPEQVPLSPAQEGLWLGHRLAGSSPTYNVPLAWRLRGPLAVDALEAAVRDVVTRHEALRTVLPERNGTPVQQIGDPDSVPFRLTALTPGELVGRLVEAAGHAFALDREPPLRVDVFTLAPDEHVLLVLAHRVAWDEWSEGPFKRDLAMAYAARRSGHAPRWRPLPVQYADYALWQRARLGEPRQIDYWTSALADLPDELALPTDRPRPSVSSGCGGAVPFDLGPDLTGKLRKLAGRSGATMFMVMRVAVAVLLTRLGAGTDLPLGVPVAGRAEPALDDLVGLFANTLAMRTDTAGDPSFTELLVRIRDADLAAFEHADVPFEWVVGALNPPSSPGRHPLFQIMVSHQGGTDAWRLADLRATAEPVGHGTAEVDLSFHFTEAADRGSLEYSADLFDRATAVELAERLLRVLRAVADGPDMPTSRVDVLSEDS